jgi:hypothetical protein
MKYIKTFESFNYKVNEEFNFSGLSENIKKTKEFAKDLAKNMPDEEKQKALGYMAEKGLTPELAKQLGGKLNIGLNDTPEEAAYTVTGVVPEVCEENSSLQINESLKEKIYDRLIRFVGMPMLTGFFTWVGSIFWRAAGLGWADQPEWIVKIHDFVGGFGGYISILFVVIAFVTFIVTLAMMFIGRKEFLQSFKEN